MRPVTFRRQARTEFDEAGDWYEKERPGLGMEFMAEIQVLIQRIASTPEQFPLLYRDVRKASPGASLTASISAKGISTSSCWLCFTARAIQRCGNNERNQRGQAR